MATLEQYEKMLGVNKLRLDDELEIQAQIQHDIGTAVAKLNTRMLEAKDDLQRYEAQVLASVKQSGEKVTVDEAKGVVLRNPERQKKWAVYQQVRETLEIWQSLHASWITKGYKMADIAALFGADYFAVTSVSGGAGKLEIPRHADAEPTRADVERRTAVQEATASRNRDEDSSRRRRAL